MPVFTEAKEPVRIERTLRSRTQPLLPVDVILADAIRPGCGIDGPVPVAGWIISAVSSLNCDHLADHPGLNDLSNLGPAPPGQTLNAHLHNPVELGCLMSDDLRFLQCVSDWLFNINVLAAQHGRHGDGSVPLVRGGDEDRVNIGALQQALMMDIGLCSGRFFLCGVEALLVDIAKGHYFDVSLVGSMLENQ